jgi:pseudouridine-5'-phosphate glycosidase
LLAVPPPAEHALPSSEIDVLVGQAVEDARAHGIRGKALTPHLLSALRRETAGRSLTTNVSLVLENARVATEVARALAAS